MKFTKRINLDDLETKRAFIDGKLAIQRGNWIKYQGVKGRIMGNSFEFGVGKYLNAVFPQNVETRLDALVDVRESLSSFLGDRLLFTFDSKRFSLKNNRYTLKNVRHSWGKIAAEHINLTVEEMNNLVLNKDGTGFFFGEIFRYKNKYKFGINPTRNS